MASTLLWSVWPAEPTSAVSLQPESSSCQEDVWSRPDTVFFCAHDLRTGCGGSPPLRDSIIAVCALIFKAAFKPWLLNPLIIVGLRQKKKEEGRAAGGESLVIIAVQLFRRSEGDEKHFCYSLFLLFASFFSVCIIGSSSWNNCMRISPLHLINSLASSGLKILSNVDFLLLTAARQNALVDLNCRIASGAVALRHEEDAHHATATSFLFTHHPYISEFGQLARPTALMSLFRSHHFQTYQRRTNRSSCF